ncbi:MAG TPA: protein kinase [Kofleriaceae bacterium]|nr:protein kinase [Kofleriaceae bacterium]
MDQVRDRIGRYHVLGRLAQGGMAEVYKVKTVGLAGFEKIQALKRILPHQAKEPRFIRSFVDEARIAVELSHRTIVQVFDFGEADGELYLAMELIEGKDLRTALAEAAQHHLPLPASLAAYVISEVGTGLDYAHRKADQTGRALGIVHCDVSPANVMLSTEGYIKILDFGVARASFASAVERRRLRGKPRYMAPEQTRGETPTPATDVFALGIVAWELLTGAPLFDGPDLPSILAAVRRADVPPVERLAPDVPEGLAAAVRAALSGEPARRGTAIGLAAAAAATAAGAGPRAMAAWLDELARRVAAAPPPEARAAERPSVRGLVSTTGSMSAVSSMSSMSSMSAAGSGDMTGDTMDRTALRAPSAIEGRPTTPLRRPLPLPITAELSEPEEPPETETHVARVPRGLIQKLRELSTFDAGSTAAMETRGDVVAAAGDAQSEPTRFEPPSFAWLGMDDDPAPYMSIDSALPDPWASESTTIGVGHLEAIDEPPEMSGPIVLVEHRRAVVVAAAFDAPASEIAALAATLGELAYKRGGLVVADDPVVAFGLEVAGEDDAATAMAFALDAQLAAREARAVVRLGGRAGVSVGGGARPRVPQDAVDEARALARDAQPERPLFAGAAGRLSTAAFTLRERPAPRRLHRRLRVVEVLGPRSFDERGRQLERRGRFVGRGAELAELEEAYQLAKSLGTRRCALVVGAAGTGKSRVVAELVARVAASGAHVIAAAAGPGAQLLPYALYTDVIDALLDLPPARGQDARKRARVRLERLLERGGHSKAAVAAAGDAWRTAMEMRDGVALLPAAPAELRVQLAQCLTAVAAAERPGRTRVVVIEDLHLADTASVAVLRDWIFSKPDRGELVLATARPDHASFPSDLVVELGDLSGEELRALCADRLAEAATPAAIAAVVARAGGNPLFVEELAAAVSEAAGTPAVVPPSARDVIAARVARLPPAAKAVLQYAAVAGDGVRAPILEELVGAGDVVAELEELRNEGHLLAGADEGALVFPRGLVREVVYESLSTRARRDAHLRIGRLLAARYHQGREEPPSIVADHLERGGDSAGAAAFWLRAARSAASAGDREAALGLWNRVLVLEGRLGVDPMTTASWARRWEARLGREAVLRERGDVAARAEDLAELERLAGNDLSRKQEVADRRAAPVPVAPEQAQVVAIQPPPTTRSPS